MKFNRKGPAAGKKGKQAPKGGVMKTKPPSRKQMNKKSTTPRDFYEVEDNDAEEDRNDGEKFYGAEGVDNYDKLPEGFDDEEIDEDEAFGDDDDEIFGDWFAGKPSARPSQAKAKAKAAAAVNLHSDEEDEDEEDDSEGELGSGGEEPEWDDEEEDEPAGAAAAASRGGAAMSDGEDDEDELLLEEAALEGDAAAELDDEGYRRMLEEAGLAGRGAAKAEARLGSSRAAARVAAREVRNEALPESALNLALIGSDRAEVTVADLLGALGDQAKSLGNARKALERLAKKAEPVSVPLPGNIKDRLERQIAYKKTKEDVSKWQSLVKANREAPTLDFRDLDKGNMPRVSTTAALATTVRPETDMEAEVAALLEKAGAANAKALEEAETSLALKEMSAEDARDRRDKLAKMRALLFYHEIKAKRLKAIKSKSYHRHMKKAEKWRALKAAMASGQDVSAELEELEKAEMQRLEERMSLRHKNTSRWARRAIHRGLAGAAPGTKAAVEEQLRLGEALKRKVERAESGTESDSGSDSEGGAGSDNPDAAPGDKAARGMSRKLRREALAILEGGEEPTELAAPPTKGLLSLPFMARAIERRRKEAQEEAKRTLEELDHEDAVRRGDAAGPMDAGPEGGRAGRFVFEARAGEGEAGMRPAKPPADSDDEFLAGSGSDREDDDAPEGDTRRVVRQIRKQIRDDKGAGPSGRAAADASAPAGAAAAAGAGAGAGAGSRAARSAGAVSVDAAAGDAVPVSVGPAGRAARSEAAARQAAFVPAKTFQGPRKGYAYRKGDKGMGYYLDTKSATPVAPSTSGKSDKAAAQQNGAAGQEKAAAAPAPEEDGGASGSDAEDDGGGGAGMALAGQRDFIREAFAGDDVEGEFAKDKATEVEAALPKEEVAGVLPGWGTWAGQKREPKWVVQQREKQESERKEAARNRKDANLKHVIISEKFDKKAAKYATPSVPFGFKTKEVYENVMRQPLGRDFNTDASFRNLTRPAILKNTGTIINPLKFAKPVERQESDQRAGREGGALGKRSKSAVSRPEGVKKVRF